MAEAETIVGAGEVPEGSTLVFRVRDGDGKESEAILLRAEDGVVAWRNYCQHMTHINLDKGSGAAMRNGEIVCTNHGAMFDADTGECTFGPCEGAYLNAVEVAVADGEVRLADPDYEFVGVGPIEDGPGDLSSTSNIEF
ncbi:MAG: Rieske (2Fe-2S) protein [Halobacteriales archaeon]